MCHLDKIEADYFDVDGQPTFDKDGIAKETFKYDEHDRIIEGACFDIDGQPVEISGACRIVYAYDATGKIIKTDRFDTNGQLVFTP